MAARRSWHSGYAGPRAPAAGFSLVEVLVATALVGFMALGIGSMMGLAVGASEASQEITELTVFAVDQLEMLNSLSFGDAQLAAGGNLARSVAGYSVDPLDGDPNAYMRWQIVDEAFSLKRITLVVGQRTTAQGNDREVAFETFRILAQ